MNPIVAGKKFMVRTILRIICNLLEGVNYDNDLDIHYLGWGTFSQMSKVALT